MDKTMQAAGLMSADPAPVSFDPGDPAELDRFVKVALSQVARSAGTGPYAEMPTRSHDIEELEDVVRVAGAVAAREYVPGPKTAWQVAMNAAVNAGRRALYEGDREVASSSQDQIDQSDDADAEATSLIERSGGQPWDEEASDSDLDRSHASEKQPKLPAVWKWRMLLGRAEDGTLGEPDQTIVKNWLMDTDQLAALTGLKVANIRQRKHRLLESVEPFFAEAPVSDVPVDERVDADDSELRTLPRTFDPAS